MENRIPRKLVIVSFSLRVIFVSCYLLMRLSSIDSISLAGAASGEAVALLGHAGNGGGTTILGSIEGFAGMIRVADGLFGTGIRRRISRVSSPYTRTSFSLA